MKNTAKTTIVMASIVAGFLVSTLAVAAVDNVSVTPHNFSIGGVSNVFTAQTGSGANQVCAFCHTPHNAGKNYLLWNKANLSGTTFKFYTSSRSLTTIARGASLSATSPSLLCLGCHDGKTAMNILHTSSSGVLASSIVGAGVYQAGAMLIPVQTGPNNGPGGNIALTMPLPLPNMFGDGYAPNMNLGMTASDQFAGNNLTDDHPIGFSYSAAFAEKGTYPSVQTLKPLLGMDPSVRFYGATKIVECTTCHDPHVNANTLLGGDSNLWPFLVKSNVGSGLCLTCHDK